MSSLRGLVQTACHDDHPSVQISALLALRTLSKQDDLKKEMSTPKMVERLSELTSTTPRPGSMTPRANSILTASLQSSRGQTSSSTVLTHCNKLVRYLQGKSSHG